MAGLTLNGQSVGERPGDGFVCLNDMWIAAGEPESLRPRVYAVKTARAKALIKALDEQLALAAGKRGRSTKARPRSVYKTGFSNKTQWWAHPIIALDYAEALSPDLSIMVKKYFLLHRRTALATLAALVERLEQEIAADDERTGSRNELAKANRALRGEGMAAGCVHPADYRKLHGAHYQGLYEMCLAEIKRRKGLPDGVSLPDQMGTPEIAANLTAKILEIERLKSARTSVPEYAAQHVEQAAADVRHLFLKYGVPPEDMAAEPHIRQAHRRMEHNLALLDLILKHADDENLDPDLADIDFDLPAPTVIGPGTVQ